MNRHSALSALLIIFIIFISCISINAAENAQTRPDIIIKISRLNQAIHYIDKMAGATIDDPTSAPSFFLRSLLFGTDWIDPNRSIVIGINFDKMTPDAKPVMAALVPYTRQNPDFHISYNAVSKIDYYIVSLPPGKGSPISDQMIYDLAEASMKKPDTMLSVELATSQLLKKADSQIEKMLLDLDTKMKAQKNTANDLTPDDVGKMLKDLIAAAKQLETISMGMDMTDSDLVIFSDAQALHGTKLSKLFTRTPESRFSYMEKYASHRHINFKSTSYDIKEMLEFFTAIFGDVYKKAGIDLAAIEPMVSNFTGEMAGGMSFKDNRMDIEMIAVMRDTDKSGAEFLASDYLPWIMDYGQKIAAFYNQQMPGKKLKNIFTKTPESTLFGNQVFGISCNIPLTMPGNTTPDKFNIKLRTTAVGNLLLAASTDERLKQLIKLAGTLKKQPYDGPVMQIDIDLGAYLGMVQKMVSQAGIGTNLNFSDMGRLIYTLDMKKGALNNKYVIKIDDIRSMILAFKQAGALAMGGENENMYAGNQSFSQSLPTMLSDPTEAQQPKPKKEDTADFWLDKGLLYATYGNDKEAIKFYKKALQIEPDNTRTLFNLGLSFSAMGNYDMAVNTLNQAISLAPDNGDYQYGLGWVYLLKGESGKAMKFISTAADLGNPDAKKYLMKNR